MAFKLWIILLYKVSHEIQALAKTLLYWRRSCVELLFELNSALNHIVESKASSSKFSTLENKGYGESFRNIDVQD